MSKGHFCGDTWASYPDKENCALCRGKTEAKPRRNTEYRITVTAPLMRPGLTIESGPVSERYVVETARSLLEMVRQINAPDEQKDVPPARPVLG